LRPGQYVWEPERAPEAPLLIVASIPEQVAYVYRNGVCIARSSVSTGRPGNPTPTGVFTILEKEVHHTSSIYKGAEMPYMERHRAARWRSTRLPRFPWMCPASA
jgi:lipoprotein-anchoring transpeptidase ErfK/SrfK